MSTPQEISAFRSPPSSLSSSLPSDVVLRVDNVSKKFCRNLKRSMWYGVTELARNFVGGAREMAEIGKLKAEDTEKFSHSQVSSLLPHSSLPDSGLIPHPSPASPQVSGFNPHPSPASPQVSGFNPHPSSGALRQDEFWALRNISFELKRGECLGLIGQNGCGKSTLLRLIAGIFPPDEGMISIRGRVGALIALGAGFHPHLTGRENVFLNGAILGLSQGEIRKKFDEIIDFAEIGEFIDAPVATYSSGMRVRLGFAVASSIEPDVLFVDEVLAVGDIGFVIKCLNTMRRLLESAAVVFVSHNMQMVSSFCSRIMMLNNGVMVFNGGDVAQGISSYNGMFSAEKTVAGSGDASITDVKLLIDGARDLGDDSLEHGHSLSVSFRMACHHAVNNLGFGLYIMTTSSEPVICYEFADNRYSFSENGTAHILIDMGCIDLSAGSYHLVLCANDNERKVSLCRIEGDGKFVVRAEKSHWGRCVRQGQISVKN